MTFVRGFVSGAVASVTCYAVYTFVFISKDEDIPDYSRIRMKESVPYLGDANRKKSKFKPDPDIPAQFSARNEDYFKSGWSRGHMAPAGNYKNDQKSMDETFFLTNIVPQDYKNNAGFWNRFEIYCRDLAKIFNDVRVFTGPLVLPDFKEDGRLYVTYPVIGQSQVSVPTHLYKVIVAETSNTNQTLIGAFVVPNKPIGYDYDLKDFQVKLEDLEIKSGITFLPKLDQTAKRADLCKIEKCQLMTAKQFELYVFGRRLQGVKNINQLHKIWKELEEKNLKPDEFLVKLYKRKRTELEKKNKKNEL
ncbi:nuclease EXOG, mitochondrial-like isoform X2 [Gigantopelta aegis]|uniref:nuclease EXOG, mitochondrial-like isoform X2 n=1 Tax=Gigantopelta aegis TaxID=1735272 RepID=UPI001B88C474|nr:nuclease EXOG, mitochondrial-like isoform X2 [Gigantopelta aegis]